ncbi:MAG: toprim domain-containing protein [Halobacteria archaeon]|nr:toprim domain-containing protein [Halobacteria archaeon]
MCILIMRWDTPRERLRQFDRVLDNIQRECRDDAVVIVEGRKDERALTRLGVEAEIVRVSGNGKSLTETVETVSRNYETAVLLTDWDSQGDALQSKLKTLLESYGVVPRTVHRKRLRNLTSKDIHDVESLAVHRRNIRSEI